MPKMEATETVAHAAVSGVIDSAGSVSSPRQVSR